MALLVITIAGTAAGGRVSERDVYPSTRQNGTQLAASLSPRSETCTARKAVKFYARRIAEHRARMGASASRTSRAVIPTSCPRYLAHLLQRKARAWRLRADRWHHWHYAWADWMPDKWQRIGACETGYGKRPGNFSWDSGTYVSFAGIIRGGYAQFARATGTPSWDAPGQRTPREQLIVASAIQARYGWGAWGCGGA